MSASLKLLDKSIPIINTKEMNKLIKQFGSMFPQTYCSPAIWICAQIGKIGFRPDKDLLTDIFKNWIRKLEEWKIVITPVVFYQCRETGLFHIKNHYNLLISWIDSDKKIRLERYEPDDATTQRGLDSELEQLLVKTLQKYTRRNISYYLVSQFGLQMKFGDKTLCGYHILYWLIYRLKYGLEQSQKMLMNPNIRYFNDFCSCILRVENPGTCLKELR